MNESSRLFRATFREKKPIIGTVRVAAGIFEEQRRRALDNFKKLKPFVDGVVIENCGWGYFDDNRATPAAAEIITRIADEIIRQATSPSFVAVGISILPNDYERAFGSADDIGADFVLLPDATGITDVERYLEVRALHEGIAVLVGIRPQEPRGDVPAFELAKRAKRLCDAIVVDGAERDREDVLYDLALARYAVGRGFPLIVSADAENASRCLAAADGVIIHLAADGPEPDERVVETLSLERRANFLKKFLGI